MCNICDQLGYYSNLARYPSHTGKPYVYDQVYIKLVLVATLLNNGEKKYYYINALVHLAADYARGPQIMALDPKWVANE